jgi:hypothetical protein
MKLSDMNTTADALRWALRRLETAGVDCGEYFARADAILTENELSAPPIKPSPQWERTVHLGVASEKRGVGVEIETRCEIAAAWLEGKHLGIMEEAVFWHSGISAPDVLRQAAAALRSEKANTMRWAARAAVASFNGGEQKAG